MAILIKLKIPTQSSLALTPTGIFPEETLTEVTYIRMFIIALFVSENRKKFNIHEEEINNK